MVKRSRDSEAEASPTVYKQSSDESDSDDSISNSSANTGPALADADPADESRSASESEYESDSDETDEPKDSSVKQSVKPTNDTSLIKNSPSKPNLKPCSAKSLSSAKLPAASVPSESQSVTWADNESRKFSKKSKNEKAVTDKVGADKEVRVLKKTPRADEKKLPFQRLWSEEDEIVILKGMLNYFKQKGVDPMGDVSNFLGYIKESLHVDVDRRQLVDKVRRLRQKYTNNLEKKKTVTPHEKNVFELSKMIWGRTDEGEMDGLGEGGNCGMNRRTVSKAAAKGAVSSCGNGIMGYIRKNGLVSSFVKFDCDSCGGENQDPFLAIMAKRCVLMGLDETVVKTGVALVGEAEKAVMVEKWRKLAVAESELVLKKIELVRQTSEMILEALQSTGK